MKKDILWLEFHSGQFLLKIWQKGHFVVKFIAAQRKILLVPLWNFGHFLTKKWSKGTYSHTPHGSYFMIRPTIGVPPKSSRKKYRTQKCLNLEIDSGSQSRAAPFLLETPKSPISAQIRSEKRKKLRMDPPLFSLFRLFMNSVLRMDFKILILSGKR